ncbi:phage baseplate assembly protein [Telmatospirillum sp.]|uniref:phage baseplate assembly protein n=1 Tax=Telmatospirillum sp. TaxID=2079197 RepID=UPI00284B7BA3|nr:hypothetical protein [Telmatospirillum sp.]MDR3438946.1 hypothetical protein [Telmatospirillum sp.]
MTDELSLIVGGARISGWTSVRVTRGIERIPSDFDIGLTERYPGEAADVVVHEGDSCQVLIGDDLVITGYVDRFIPGIEARQHTIKILGRGKCQDLVDCSAEWPNGQISGSSALGIAQKLASPYGITVTAGAEVGPAIPQFNLMYGETPFEVIERICRYSALLAYDLPDGNLYLSRVGTTVASSGFVQGQNIEKAEAVYSMDQRYSEYEVLRQSMDNLGDSGSGGNLLSIVKDAGVPRHRRHVIICESGGGAGEDVAKKRGLWEAARRAGRSNQVHIVADSWRDSAGTLWTPNTLVSVSLPALKIQQVQWLIGEVSFMRGEGGSTTNLTIMPPDAFLPQPIVLQPMWADVPAGVAR